MLDLASHVMADSATQPNAVPRSHARRRRVLWAVGVFAMLAAAMGLGAVWRTVRTRATVANFLPSRPARIAENAPLQARITAVERRASRLGSSTNGLVELGRLYHANGFMDEAACVYDGLCKLEPREARWPYLRADILGGFGQLDEAIVLMKRAVALAPAYVSAQIRLAEMLTKSGRNREAVDVLDAVRQHEPDHPYALVALARIAVSDARWTEARELLERAARVHPDFSPAWALLVSIREHLGDQPRGDSARLRGLNSGAESMPDPWKDALMRDCYDVYRLDVAAVQIAERDLSGAIALLRQALKLDARSAPVHRHLGTMLERAGERDAARTHLERAAVLAPEADGNWLALAGFFERTSDVTALDRALAAAFKHCPESSRVLLAVGSRLIERGHFPEARAALQRSLWLEPHHVETYVALGRLHMVQREYQECVAVMRRALDLVPEHPVALVGVARAAIALGDLDEARAWCEVVQQAPSVPPDDRQGVMDQFRARFEAANVR